MRVTGSEFLMVNMGLLRCFQEPTSAYELFRCGAWRSYSGIHPQVVKLRNLGLITLAFTGRTERNSGVKKFWVLTEKGRVLLKLFSEESEEAGL